MRIIYVLSWIVTIFAILSIVSHAFGVPWGLDAIHGTSMEPLITEDDIVVVMPYSPRIIGEPDVGDIVVFKSDKTKYMVMHRIFAALNDDGGYITKGDNIERPDQEFGMDIVKSEDIYGFVPQIMGYPLLIPKIGILTHAFLQFNPNLRHYLSGFILMFLVISLVIDSRRILLGGR
ncbi:MAG: Peptidase S24-like protein [Candidatus Syntrophoarchaeum sp. GoM_oil]|nr:MAG: Peptidase S24-like protein [Candidatus Syntrophoarchaeum sp. GoM_oil]